MDATVRTCFAAVGDFTVSAPINNSINKLAGYGANNLTVHHRCYYYATHSLKVFLTQSLAPAFDKVIQRLGLKLTNR